MPEARRRKMARWEPDSKKNGKQFDLVNRITKLCGLFKNWTALVWFGRQSDPAARDGLIPLRDLAVMTVALENNGAWKRVVTLGGHVAKGHALIGGGGFDPIDMAVEKADDAAENGMDGWWQTPAGDFFLRDDLPAAYKGDAKPEGHFKDVGAHPRSFLSLYSNDGENHKANAATRARLGLVLDEIEGNERIPVENRLRAPTFLVAAGSKPIVIRALAAEHTGDDALAFDTLTAMNLTLGSWIIPECKGVLTPCALMDPGELGIVTAVTPDEITITHGEAILTAKNPASIIRNLIKDRTGRDAADLDVVPIVEEGQQIAHDSCLWGPMRPHSIGARSLRPKGESVDARHARRRADLLGIWSVLAEGWEYNDQSVYPIQLVVPQTSARVYVALTDKDGDYAGAQRIALSGVGCVGATLATKRREPGVRINLRNTSIRSWQSRERRERREREHRENK